MGLSIEHLAAKYIESLLIANFSRRTIGNYRGTLGKFMGYLKSYQVDSPDQITKELLQDYQAFIAGEKNKFGRNNAVKSQNNTLKIAIYFCRFMADNDFILKDPTRGIRYAREPKCLPRDILSPAEAKKILEQPDHQTPTGYRDRAILELFYSSAIRNEELRNLDLSDLDCPNATLMVRHGKGNKDRYVPIGKTACQCLEGYLCHIRPVFLRDFKPTDALFLSNRGTRIGHSCLDATIKKYARMAKLTKKVSPHTFRHTCATHLVNNGMNIRHVQALLGHASLSSTQIYTRVAISDLKRVLKKHHPREKTTKKEARVPE
ncbi:hypothetical protein A2276_08700 [candidate division WOR-1 bacterium RIFOXYA12_FULL_43_27]|uniref:Tyrosine recombinase XerC n=1 Tax=candidate division WOR-1 bacterium RIFOXYC2_FULL_46_14 TaxID=1802587 RepID=A0A1F4U323_UNCSA|nr:MAG: hypothetical protein A2276_08700 [candidate division WOR-1 bacterium RIFOXYA12_FULL_43_27]OGC19730.1 MAG: hypothetical protein A2292_08565 [candidate division WOR-1 bacterium RIFOXYB2_FULL_46_45]OGC30679.1 MAG: hypothetical protein A2232_02890 [candidate division WOR-1 bacterium RIFOXYA2_FULL_46_56]OGC39230.1 MAG: hypothetical protein A2438_07605 [candidate division WOR-1 bacterium RIFOXYC2_FULL_46_14]